MAKKATIGIVISTPGRKSLWRTLMSIAYQSSSVEDVLVVGDGFHKPTKDLIGSMQSLLPMVRYVATQKTRDWGHSQVNYGLQNVRGDYVTYQDDDDCYVPRALDEMSRLCSEFDSPRPMIGRVKTPNFGLLWQIADPTKAVLDGHCLVAPNDKKRIGWMRAEYNGDQGLIHTTLRNYRNVAWVDRVWTLTRPHWKLVPWWGTQGNCSWSCDLRRDDEALSMAATILMEADRERDIFYATVDTYRKVLSLEEYREIAEFLVYAGQSRDIWIKVPSSDAAFLESLQDRGYHEHVVGDSYTELTHDWPPDFWPQRPPFTRILDTEGKPIPDWRDEIWGGRAVEEP